jgi:2-methylisocitrate lyase-like PEP mutase family enzyme
MWVRLGERASRDRPPSAARFAFGPRRGWSRRYLGAVSERQDKKAARFRALHEGPPFLIPNPWDVGSARLLEALGFEALATSSSAFAFTLGRFDGETSLDEVAGHVRALDQATELPLSVDLENGYGPEPEDAARAIERAAEAGAVGGSIEDFDPAGRLYELGDATERVAAAAEAAQRLDFPFTFTARAENHIRGNPDLDDTIARLQAYEGAGADVLYAPGLASGDQVRAVCAATTRPVNVLAHAGLTMDEIVAAGAQRVSVGGSLAWTALESAIATAEAMRDQGDFSSLASPARVRELLGG